MNAHTFLEKVSRLKLPRRNPGPFIDTPKSYERRVLVTWFIQGHLEESRSQIRDGEPGWSYTHPLHHLFHVGYLPPFIRDNLIKVTEIYSKSPPVG